MEDLSIENMVKNKYLARSILDVGWGEFKRQLEYKCLWYGKNLIKIGRFEPSSKMCSKCYTINRKLTLNIREWTCNSCKTVHDRDTNAAINIKQMAFKQNDTSSKNKISVGEIQSKIPQGLRKSTLGDSAVRRKLNQESLIK